MISDVEAAVQRANTDAFIAADFINVALTQRVRVATASGGWTVVPDPEPLPSQVMRLIPQSSGAASVERETLDGRIVKPEFVLLGSWDAVMGRGDRFSFQGNEYEVAYVHERRDYETKGEVAYVGKA